MARIEKRTYSGCVLEREFFILENIQKAAVANPRPRFLDEADRQRHKDNISRVNHTRMFNTNFSPSSLYITLTFDADHEVHDFIDAKRIRNKFLRRLRRKYPDAVIFMYMGRGRETSRIHFHMVSEGIPAKFISKQWKYGSVTDVDHLREHNFYDDGTGAMIDHGQDYTGLANYLFDHWERCPELQQVCKHRYYHSKNAKKSDKEYYKEVKRNYTPENPPITLKGYKLVDIKTTKYGYINFIYVVDQDLRRPKKSDKRFYRSLEDDYFTREPLPDYGRQLEFDFTLYIERAA